MILATIIMNAGLWSEHFNRILKDPTGYIQSHWIWLLVALLTLFILSRVNNYMEVKSVNRAIYLARGMVGTVMAFVVAPIIFLILLNVYAWFNGLPLFNLIFLWDWFALTLTTFWWLLKSIGMPRGDYIYDINSLIRLGWIIIPVSFIWLRVASSNFGRLLLIPFIAGLFFLTAFKHAEPTFLNKYLPQNLKEFKIGGGDHISISDRVKRLEDPNEGGDSYVDTKTKEVTREVNSFYKENAIYFTLALLFLLALAIFLGFYTKNRMFSLILILICLGLFYLMMKTSPPPEPIKRDQIVINPTYKKMALLDLCTLFEKTYVATGESIKSHEISVAIRYKLTMGKRELPLHFCTSYRMYFYDYCQTAE